jgi:hypothetical protein
LKRFQVFDDNSFWFSSRAIMNETVDFLKRRLQYRPN